MCIFFINACSFNANINIDYDNRKYHTLQYGETFLTVQSICISWIEGDVCLSISDEITAITCYEETLEKYDDPYLAQVYFDEKTNGLDIKYCDSGIEMVKKYGKSLKIVLPSHFILENLTIDNLYGNTIIKDVKVKNDVQIRSSTGMITTENVQSMNLFLQTTSNVVYIKLPSKQQNIYLTKISGSILLDISESISGFLVQLNQVTGEIKSEFSLQIDEELNQQIYANSFNEERELYIYLNEVSGNITINKYFDELH